MRERAACTAAECSIEGVAEGRRPREDTDMPASIKEKEVTDAASSSASKARQDAVSRKEEIEERCETGLATAIDDERLRRPSLRHVGWRRGREEELTSSRSRSVDIGLSSVHGLSTGLSSPFLAARAGEEGRLVGPPRKKVPELALGSVEEREERICHCCLSLGIPEEVVGETGISSRKWDETVASDTGRERAEPMSSRRPGDACTTMPGATAARWNCGCSLKRLLATVVPERIVSKLAVPRLASTISCNSLTASSTVECAPGDFGESIGPLLEAFRPPFIALLSGKVFGAGILGDECNEEGRLTLVVSKLSATLFPDRKGIGTSSSWGTTVLTRRLTDLAEGYCGRGCSWCESFRVG